MKRPKSELDGFTATTRMVDHVSWFYYYLFSNVFKFASFLFESLHFVEKRVCREIFVCLFGWYNPSSKTPETLSLVDIELYPCSLVRWDFVHTLEIIARILSEVVNRERLCGTNAFYFGCCQTKSSLVRWNSSHCGDYDSHFSPVKLAF